MQFICKYEIYILWRRVRNYRLPGQFEIMFNNKLNSLLKENFHRYRRYHIRDQRESTRLRQANTNTLNHDSYQKNNVTSQSTRNCLVLFSEVT
jgi:hypothetical protein